MQRHDTKILRIDSSGRYEGSQTRELTDEFISTIKSRHAIGEIVTRDLAEGIEFVDQEWIFSNFTDVSERSEHQKQRLAVSDQLVAELEDADLIVIGLPIYNFGIPAVLKAWIDQVARARKTFKYTENGPVGLLENKRAVLIVASGGTPVESPVDFAVPYMKHVLGFLGIHDVEVIAADQIMVDAEKSTSKARKEIERFGLVLAA